MRWGLIPFWAKDTKIGYKMINARAETIMERSSFKNAFRKRRCLVPADSFYEWRKDGKIKTPLRIMLKSEEPFAFAGLWETWKDKSEPDAPTIHSCTIITTTPNSLMESIHDRKPVILPREYYSTWVDLENEDTDELMEMLTPYDSSQMKAYEVSTLVNSPKNQGEELVMPVG
jgi:putative SOS response-associated peptidase YedK